jgi:hypothetical protein
MRGMWFDFAHQPKDVGEIFSASPRPLPHSQKDYSLSKIYLRAISKFSRQ